jgi:hypothetical protein
LKNKSKLEVKYAEMAWVLLEYEVVHFLQHALTRADQYWIEYRTISNEDYDKKVEAFSSLAKQIKKKATRPVGCGIDKASVRLVIERFAQPMCADDFMPIFWPDEKSETDDELMFRICEEIRFSIYNTIQPKKKIVRKKLA